MFSRARGRSIVTWLLLLFGAAIFPDRCAHADGPEAPTPIPSEAEVIDLLRREPFSLENWPTWRVRLKDWLDDKRNRTEPAFTGSEEFLKSVSNGTGELPPPLRDDPLAWYLFARARWRRDSGEAIKETAGLAEECLRRSIALDPGFARAHRNLGTALLVQAPPGNPQAPQAQEAEREIQAARDLDPNTKVKGAYAFAAIAHSDFARAEKLYAEAVAEDPESVDYVLSLAACVLQNKVDSRPRAPRIAPLLVRHGDNAKLACLHAVALAMDGNARAAAGELSRARQLGGDPAKILNAELVKAIEAEARPGLLQLLIFGVAIFAGFYAVVMGAMALAGFLLARWTRGAEALRLIGDQPLEIVQGGQIERTESEPWLARFYAVCLVCGLVLFYISLPFVTIGLLICTLGALWLLIQIGRIPVKLFVIILFVGLAMTWAVLKSMFARMGSGSFGLKRTETDAPRLFEALREVARRVDTPPVDEVYVAPGAEIGVHQEGRGPWGIFGTKRRVLTLGLSTMRVLSISELKSILAHEYAHFSHRDTFYSRFIHRVDLSIHSALEGMGSAGGKLNYVNPFYWFLVLYYRAYSMLSAGFSRSREFLADRMSCSLYGSNVFTSALTKVVTEGRLFEMTMYQSVSELLAENKAFVNMYEAFDKFRNGVDSQAHREQIRKELDEARPSLFASHPSDQERLAAAALFPPSRNLDDTPAIQLFEDPEAIEKELTSFLSDAIHFVQQQQALAAAQSE